MSAAKFRRIALSMPQATEGAHMGHPDFRVKGRIFATLFSRDGVEWGMAKLKPDQQRLLTKTKPEIFEPIKGGWGCQGCTQVCLYAEDQKSLREAIFTAWCNTAPASLLQRLSSISKRGVKKSTRGAPRSKAQPTSKKKAAKKATKRKK